MPGATKAFGGCCSFSETVADEWQAMARGRLQYVPVGKLKSEQTLQALSLACPKPAGVYNVSWSLVTIRF